MAIKNSDHPASNIAVAEPDHLSEEQSGRSKNSEHAKKRIGA